MSNISNDTFLSAQLLNDFFNLKYDNILSLKSFRNSNSLNIFVTLNIIPHLCPDCGSFTSSVKDYTTKNIKHSILHSSPCFIIYRARRLICKVCKRSFLERNPFTTSNSKISSATVFNVLNDLKNENETFSSVASRYFLSSTTVADIFDKHVAISRMKMPEILCIDEVYAFKGYHSKYVCILLDFNTKNIVDVLPSRKKDNIMNYFQYIPRDERNNIKFISIDMWDTYRIVSKTLFPQAKLIVDKFHCLADLTKKAQALRIKIMNSLRVPKNIKDDELSLDDKKSIELRKKQYSILKKFNFLLFKYEIPNANAEKRFNKLLNRYCNYYDLYTYMLDIHQDLNIMNNMVFRLQRFFKESNHHNARRDLEILIKDCRATDLIELHDYANTLSNWKNEIINSFIVVGTKTVMKNDKNTGQLVPHIVDVKITNGIIESRNKIIKSIKRNANGYKNWHRFRNRILYVLNKDATFHLYPINNVVQEKKKKQQR